MRRTAAMQRQLGDRYTIGGAFGRTDLQSRLGTPLFLYSAARGAVGLHGGTLIPATVSSGDVLRWNWSGFDAARVAGSALWVGEFPFSDADISVAASAMTLNGNDSPSTNEINLWVTTAFSGDMNFIVKSGSTTYATISGATPWAANDKLAFLMTWQADEAKLYQNGAKIGEDLSVTVPAVMNYLEVNRRGSGQPHTGGTTHLIAVFPRVLSETEARQITGNPHEFVY